MNMNKCTSKQFFLSPPPCRLLRSSPTPSRKKTSLKPQGEIWSPAEGPNLSASASRKPTGFGVTTESPHPSPSPSQIAVDPGSGHHETALWKASKNENPPRRGASSSAVVAASAAAVDADAAGEQWSPKLLQEPNRVGPWGIDGTGARVRS